MATDAERWKLEPSAGNGHNGDVEVTYRVAGDGPPAVLLRGDGFDAVDVARR